LIVGDQHDLAQAEELHRQALEVGRDAPPNDRDSWLNNIANVREKGGDLNEAFNLHVQALALRTNVFEHNHPEVAASLDSLARVLLKQGKPLEAQFLAQQSLDIWQQRDTNDWRFFNAQSLVGGCLLGQTNCQAAKPLLHSGYEGMTARAEQMPKAGRTQIRQVLERLVQLYEAWDKPEQATDWRRKLEEFEATLSPPAP